MFYPLYPIGIGAEWWLLYRAIAPGRKISVAIPPVFYFCLLLYIPGKYAARFIGVMELTKMCRLVQNVHVHDPAKTEDTLRTAENDLIPFTKLTRHAMSRKR